MSSTGSGLSLLASRALLVLLAGVVLLFFDFGFQAFTTNDDARFPLLARDILREGHWLLPRLNGSPHVDKPPLQAWLIALASWPGGAVTQASAVLPSLLAALGVVLATFWIASQFFGRDGAVTAGLISVTMYGAFTLARTPAPDMVFCAELTAAMAAYVAAEVGRRPMGWIAFYALVGLAVWTKGPAGLLPFAIVLLDTLTTHGWRGPVRLVSIPGLLLFTALLLPWWVLAASVAGAERFWIDVARNDWLQWYLPTRGWSWHLVTEGIPQTITVLLPWSLLLPAAWWWAAHVSDREARRHLRLLQLWLGIVLVLVSISQQQRMRYYLPLCPPAALLVAGWYASRTWRGRTVAFAGVWLLSALGLSVWVVSANSRTNRETGLPAIARALADVTAPVYAVKVPELVLAFYLDRPVRVLASPRDVERWVRDDREAYLIIADHMLPALPSTLPIRLVATGLLNQRPLSVFALDPTASRS